jgi:hypothetical protein
VQVGIVGPAAEDPAAEGGEHGADAGVGGEDCDENAHHGEGNADDRHAEEHGNDEQADGPDDAEGEAPHRSLTDLPLEKAHPPRREREQDGAEHEEHRRTRDRAAEVACRARGLRRVLVVLRGMVVRGRIGDLASDLRAGRLVDRAAEHVDVTVDDGAVVELERTAEHVDVARDVGPGIDVRGSTEDREIAGHRAQDVGLAAEHGDVLRRLVLLDAYCSPEHRAVPVAPVLFGGTGVRIQIVVVVRFLARVGRRVRQRRRLGGRGSQGWRERRERRRRRSRGRRRDRLRRVALDLDEVAVSTGDVIAAGQHESQHLRRRLLLHVHVDRFAGRGRPYDVPSRSVGDAPHRFGPRETGCVERNRLVYLGPASLELHGAQGSAAAQQDAERQEERGESMRHDERPFP